MENTVFKTFIYSFSVSLFAIFAANRAFFHTSEMQTQPVKIPEKNITLFLKDSSLAPIKTVAVPSKKIVLSSVADIPLTKPDISDAAEHQEIPVNVPTLTVENASGQNSNEEEIVLAENSSIPLIDSEEKNITHAENEKISDTHEESLRESEKIHINIPILQNSASKEGSITEEQISPEKKIVYMPEENKEIAPQKEISSQAVNTAENKSPTSLLPQTEVKLAANEPSASTNNNSLKEKTTSNELIPLEIVKDYTKTAQAGIISSNKAEKNLVALNAQDTPIRSMNAKAAEKESSDKNDPQKKQWESMAQKKAKANSDSPWVVAKGKSFPTNQMIMQDEHFKMSDAEVKKIFENQSQANSDTDNQNIQLASETVQNLLIPIPEDILKDENLVPQLISSPRNQEIKEELEAKGLIKKEEPKEEKIAEQPTSTTEKSTAEKTSDDTPTSSSGILTSLTSLFSKDTKENLPELGNSVESEEEPGSLFSAFTRKQNRLMTKILPTEIRLSFQPNRAEISGQTLKWIKAFAQKTAEEQSTGLEIRIDGTSSPVLQRRRLNLLQNILINEGASPEKIHTVFTAREPNSFILRTTKINVDKPNLVAKDNNRYMQW